MKRSFQPTGDIDPSTSIPAVAARMSDRRAERLKKRINLARSQVIILVGTNFYSRYLQATIRHSNYSSKAPMIYKIDHKLFFTFSYLGILRKNCYSRASTFAWSSVETSGFKVWHSSTDRLQMGHPQRLLWLCGRSCQRCFTTESGYQVHN